MISADTRASDTPDLEPITFNKEGVKELLQNLDTCQVPGTDKIQSLFLKEYEDNIAPILTKIFQRNGKKQMLQHSLRKEIEMTLAIRGLSRSLAWHVKSWSILLASQ